MPTLPPAVYPPPLLCIYQDKLIEYIISAAPRCQQLADLPDAGEILAATVMGDAVFVLCEQGLQRVRLADGSCDLVLRFEVPARFGQIMPTADGDRLLYSTTVDDASAPFGTGTYIGLYQVSKGKEQVKLHFRHDEQVLGLTADGRGLYFLPRGQDSSFGRLLMAALDTGQVESELSVGGIVPTALSHDSRHLAMASLRSTSADEHEDVLNLYDLTSRPPALHQFAFPHAPSHTRWLLWSPDSRFLYFVLWSGPSWGYPMTSYGLWRLDMKLGTLSQVAAVTEHPLWPKIITFEGQWLLLQHETKGLAVVIHVPSGAYQYLTLPAGSVVAGWRAWWS